MKTRLVIFGDPHSGSPLGLMRPKTWQLQNGNYTPNKLQRLLWKMWDADTAGVGESRGDARLIVIANGDLVEGVHHNNKQIITNYIQEQEEISIDAIDHGLQNMRFDADAGDKLIIVSGTPSHVDESEERIARDLGALPYEKPRNEHDGRYTHPALRLIVDGVRVWTAHKLAGAGRGANRGNALRNKAKEFYFEALADGMKPPDYLIGSHFHQRLYSPYVYRSDIVNAFIMPPYKAKDNYTFGISPFGLGDIGLLVIDIENGASSWRFTEHQIEQLKELRL